MIIRRNNYILINNNDNNNKNNKNNNDNNINNNKNNNSRNDNNCKEASWSFRLRSKSIKKYGEKNNDHNNIKLKEMGIMTPITDHYPRNEYIRDTDPPDTDLVCYIESGNE